MHRLLSMLLGMLGAFPLTPLFAIHASGASSTELKTMPTTTNFNKLLAPGKRRVTFRLDDYNRTFVFVTPREFKPGDPLPIVFFFHGAGGTAERAAEVYGWSEKADAEHFFAVFPQGLPAHPNIAGSFLINPWIWRDERNDIPDSNVDDVRFFEELLNKLEAVLPIDPRRVYVTGFSNGAGMTFTLGTHFPDRIAAIAPVSSETFVQVDKLSRPLPVFYLVGAADPLVPYEGGTVTLPWGNSRTLPPVQDSVDTWVHLDGCPPQPQIITNQNGVRVLRYGPGRNDSEILFTTVKGNGHHWPGTVEPLPQAICGPTADPFHATDWIWDFFKKHPLTKSD